MLRILTSAPQIGEVTVNTWLAHIITPQRFPNTKAVAALRFRFRPESQCKTCDQYRRGCKELHKVLASSADRFIRSRMEIFGKYSYSLYLQTGKWKKVANVAARKLATALYYMMLTSQEFSYESYSLMKDISVFDIPCDKTAIAYL